MTGRFVAAYVDRNVMSSESESTTHWPVTDMQRLPGALLIAHWAWKLMRDAATVLVDRSGDPAEDGDDRVYDLHLWRIGPGHPGL
jgi:Co/Zn/Cd efflux system component